MAARSILLWLDINKWFISASHRGHGISEYFRARVLFSVPGCNHNLPMPRVRHGFTLVELLVTISIVGLLAAMLIPAIHFSRRSARRMECSSHLRQIGIALDQYLDSRGARAVYPYAAMFPGIPPGTPSIAEVLAPFVEASDSIFICPDDPKFADLVGLSYEYESLILAGKRRAATLITAQGEHRPSTQVWVSFDFSNFHGPAGDDGSRNYLYADGHVDSIADPSP